MQELVRVRLLAQGKSVQVQVQPIEPAEEAVLLTFGEQDWIRRD